MRVTKTIRNYVEKRIEKAFPLDIKEVAPEYAQVKERYEEFQEEFQTLIEELAENLFNSMLDPAYKYDFPEDFGLSYRFVYGGVATDYNHTNKLEIDYRKRLEEIRKKKAEKEEDILLTLELGGGRAELEEALSHLTD